MRDDVIALFEFEVTDEQVTVRDEKHYRLVAPDELTPEETGAISTLESHLKPFSLKSIKLLQPKRFYFSS